MSATGVFRGEAAESGPGALGVKSPAEGTREAEKQLDGLRYRTRRRLTDFVARLTSRAQKRSLTQRFFENSFVWSA